MNIDEKNYEEYLIRHVENDLSENEQATLFVFLDNHPECRRELELFEQSRLIPDETISFGDRSSLKRTAQRFYLNNWLVWTSAAAAILVLIYFKFVSPEMNGANSAALRQNSASDKSAQTIASNNSAGSSSANPDSNANPNSQKPGLPARANKNIAVQSPATGNSPGFGAGSEY